jgi:hypothetical protein
VYGDLVLGGKLGELQGDGTSSGIPAVLREDETDEKVRKKGSDDQVKNFSRPNDVSRPQVSKTPLCSAI